MKSQKSNNPIKRVAPERVINLEADEIFVFGSNLQGLHYGGAARLAVKWGAVLGQGVGLQGQTYAIPTVFKTPKEIKPYVDQFIEYAEQHPEKIFLVTEIGCGIAGFTPEQIAPLFKQASDQENVWLPERFINFKIH